MLRNKVYKTSPFVIHNPFIGRDGHHFWLSLQEKLETIKFCRLPGNLSIVTWNNKESLSLLERQMTRLGINHTVLGKGIPWETNRLKLDLLVRNIGLFETEYLLGMDAYDVQILRDLYPIVSAFLEKDTNLIFNAGTVNHPPSPEYEAIEVNLCQHKPFSFLNSGVFIGRTEYIHWAFKKALTMTNDVWPYSDQALLKPIYHQEWPKIKIDGNASLFQVFNPFQEDIEDYLTIERESLL